MTLAYVFTYLETGCLIQDGFNCCRCNVFTSTYDHVLIPPRDSNFPFRIHHGLITSNKPLTTFAIIVEAVCANIITDITFDDTWSTLMNFSSHSSRYRNVRFWLANTNRSSRRSSPNQGEVTLNEQFWIIHRFGPNWTSFCHTETC